MSESNDKVKIYHQIVYNIPSSEELNKNTVLTPLGSSTELARVTVRAGSDHKGIRVYNWSFELGSGSKLEKFLNLLIFISLFNVLFFSIYRANEF